MPYDDSIAEDQPAHPRSLTRDVHSAHIQNRVSFTYKRTVQLSYQTARIRRLIWGYTVHIYQTIVVNGALRVKMIKTYTTSSKITNSFNVLRQNKIIYVDNRKINQPCMFAQNNYSMNCMEQNLIKSRNYMVFSMTLRN